MKVNASKKILQNVDFEILEVEIFLLYYLKFHKYRGIKNTEALKIFIMTNAHRSMAPKSVTPTAPSCLDISWRSTTLSLPKKLTSSAANLERCHVHFIRDAYITFIRRVIDQAKTPWNYFSTQNWTLIHLKSWLGYLSPYASGFSVLCRGHGEINHVGSRYFGTNWIIGNWHWRLEVIRRIRKKYFHQ